VSNARKVEQTYRLTNEIQSGQWQQIW